jgi:hypothetical protein
VAEVQHVIRQMLLFNKKKSHFTFHEFKSSRFRVFMGLKKTQIPFVLFLKINGNNILKRKISVKIRMDVILTKLLRTEWVNIAFRMTLEYFSSSFDKLCLTPPLSVCYIYIDELYFFLFSIILFLSFFANRTNIAEHYYSKRCDKLYGMECFDNSKNNK